MLHFPEFQLGDLGQVHQTQEVKVDGEDLAARFAGGGADGFQVLGGNERGQVQLIVGGVGKALARLLQPAHVHSHGVPVHHFGNGIEHPAVGNAHHVVDGLTNDGVEDHQDNEGDEGPQAAAHGVDLLLGVELLDLLIVALPVVAVLLLQLLHLALEHVHLDHAALALQGQGEQHHLDHQREQDQRQAVAAAEVIKNLEQP